MTAPEHKIAEWRNDPVVFVRDHFGVEPDAWQVRVLRAFASREPAHQRIAMQACAGPGKTAVLAWCGLNFLACYGDKGAYPKGGAVSVSGENLRDNLWAELSLWRGRSEYLTTALEMDSDKLYWRGMKDRAFISARAWPKTANAEEQGKTLSGLHAPFVLMLIDESGGIPVPVERAAEQALSTEGLRFGKIMQAGNPLTRQGMLYSAVSSGKYFVVRVTGDPDDPERAPRISIDWAREMIALHGRDNPWVQAYVLGLFPRAAINTLLSPDEVRDAFKREVTPDMIQHARRILGVDCARFGDDRSVLFPRQGLKAFMPVEMRHDPSGAPAIEIRDRVLVAHERWGHEHTFIDVTGGWGMGARDALMGAKCPGVEGVEFAGAAGAQFKNKRAEMWWRMAEWVKRGGSLPQIESLVKELTEPTYTFTPDDKILIEPKKQVKERIGHSPDLADALALTFSMPEANRVDPFVAMEERRQRRELSDWDPLRAMDRDSGRNDYEPMRM